MNKLTLCLLFLCSTFALSAQEIDKKYLAGAVPEENGKVLMTRSIKISNEVPNATLFNLVEQWAQKEYAAKDDPKRRVALVKADEFYLVCQGGDPLVFKASLLMRDEVAMRYQLVIRTEVGAVNLEFRNIKYDPLGGDEILTAEETITDAVAVHKDGDKLNRFYNKYRTFTIDRIDELKESLLNELSQVQLETVKKEVVPVAPSIVSIEATPLTPAMVASEPSVVPMTPLTPAIAAQGLAGYKKIEAEKIPGNIVKMLKDDWTLITSGSGDNVNVMTASWGGLGHFWNKSIAMSFLNPTRHSISTMDKGDTYTISFYTEMYRDKLTYCGTTSGKNTDKIKGSGLTPILTPSGATAFAEAWMIIECKKVVAQPIAESAVADKELAKEWSKDGYHKIYIGEILNVWVR